MNHLPNGTKALLFAAGLGTRLKPFTDHHPKALALVNGKPLLQRNIEYLKRFGINDFVINVHHFADQIISFVEKQQFFRSNIHFSHEVLEPLETGGGLVYAKDFLKGSYPFVVMNADILTTLDISKFYQAHVEHHALATLAITHRESSRGFLYNENSRLTGWRNMQTGETKLSIKNDHPKSGSFSGVHIIDPKIFDLVNRTGKFSIIDLYLELAAAHPIYIYDHSGDVVVDVGKPESIEKAEQIFK
jgi:N-acetyl-alpha-D-muramate 1-phosphate uridylyltransferase